MSVEIERERKHGELLDLVQAIPDSANKWSLHLKGKPAIPLAPREELVRLLRVNSPVVTGAGIATGRELKEHLEDVVKQNESFLRKHSPVASGRVVKASRWGVMASAQTSEMLAMRRALLDFMRANRIDEHK